MRFDSMKDIKQFLFLKIYFISIVNKESLVSKLMKMHVTNIAIHSLLEIFHKRPFELTKN